MLKEFKQFLLRGNVVDLAVGIAVGAAFGAVITALVKDIISPLVAAIIKVPNFSGLSFVINGSRFMYGDFINSVVTFLIVATVVFFLVVKPMNMLIRRFNRDSVPGLETKKCKECLGDIPRDAKRCMHCTQVVI